MLTALEEHLGIVSKAAKRAGIDRATHYNWIKSNPEYAQKVIDIEESTLDFGESALHKKITDGDTTAIIFFLKCKGKKRGYSEHVNVEIAPPLNIVLKPHKQAGEDSE